MTVYKIDFNRGSDSNDGISAPFKNLTKISTLSNLQAGDMILLADDSTWNHANGAIIQPPTALADRWDGTRAAPVVIGKYSPSSQSIGQYPIIGSYVDTAPGDWTYDAPNNGWTYTTQNSTGQNGDMHLVLGGDFTRASCRQSSAGNLPLTEAWGTLDGQYSYDGGTLHLYAPAGTNPVAYYEGVRIYEAGGVLGTAQNTGWIAFDGLKFQECAAGVRALASANTVAENGCIIRNCRAYKTAMVWIAQTGSQDGKLRVLIENNYAELSGLTAIGVKIDDDTKDNPREVIIRRNHIVEGGYGNAQGAIKVKGSGTTLVGQIYDNRVERWRNGVQNKDLDGSAVYLETRARRWEIRNNIAIDCHLAFQDNSGESNLWEGNVALNCNFGFWLTDAEQRNGGPIKLYRNTVIAGGTPQSNLGDELKEAVRCAKGGATAMQLDIRDNLFVNKRSTTAGLCAISAPVAGWTGTISGNAGQNWEGMLKDDGNVVETDEEILVTSGLCNTETGRPTADSVIDKTGTHTGYLLDADGRLRANPPTIGAYEV